LANWPGHEIKKDLSWRKILHGLIEENNIKIEMMKIASDLSYAHFDKLK
jgi:hypothetical protein